MSRCSRVRGKPKTIYTTKAEKGQHNQLATVEKAKRERGKGRMRAEAFGDFQSTVH